MPSGHLLVDRAPTAGLETDCLGRTTVVCSTTLPALRVIAGFPDQRAFIRVLADEHFLIRRPVGSGGNLAIVA